MRLEKVVVRRLVGILKLLPFKSLKVHRMFSVCTSGEASEMVKFKETLLSWIPPPLPGQLAQWGELRDGKEEKTAHDSSSAVCNVVCWWMRPEVQLVQVAGVASLQCTWCCVVEGLLQYLVQ